MSSTYLGLHFHIVFATKDRQPFIGVEWRSRLHEYLGGIIKGLGGVSERVGGVADHVHLLVSPLLRVRSLRSTHGLADVLRELEKSSSEWVHTEIRQPDFAWQVGYAAFTVGPRDRGGVGSYIDHQEEHHRTRTSRDELLEMLALAEIEYDPRYFE